MTKILGPGTRRLVVDGVDVAPLVVARTHREKGRGLLGYDGIDGALWFHGTSSVHMVGMRFAIDVAVLDHDGIALHVATLRPWTGATRPRLRGRSLIEAAAGSMAEWGLDRGSHCSVL